MDKIDSLISVMNREGNENPVDITEDVIDAEVKRYKDITGNEPTMVIDYGRGHFAAAVNIYRKKGYTVYSAKHINHYRIGRAFVESLKRRKKEWCSFETYIAQKEFNRAQTQNYADKNGNGWLKW